MAMFASTDVLAGGGPENVFLVVNEHSLSSKLIANHYSDIRKIPENNVLYLREVPNKDVVSIEQFKELILQPILKEIDLRRLDGTIDYIVYSSGFPTRVSVKDTKTCSEKSLAGRLTARLLHPWRR